MRVLTLNTWKCDGAYRERLQRMAKGLVALAPDIVLLQESFASDDGVFDSAAFLAQALSMVVTHAPARRKTRQFEGRPCPSSSGLAVLSRRPALEHHVLSLPVDPADGERIAQLLRYPGGPQDWWVVNVHLSHLRGASALRTRQLQTCLTALRSYAGPAPSLIAGDFNATPGTEEFRQLLGSPEGFFNPFAGYAKATHRDEAGVDHDLDHILLSSPWSDRVLNAGVALDPCSLPRHLHASDHAAVLLDLDLSR